MFCVVSTTEEAKPPTEEHNVDVGAVSPTVAAGGLSPSEKPILTVIPNKNLTANEHINIASLKPREVSAAFGQCASRAVCLSPHVDAAGSRLLLRCIVLYSFQIVDELDKYIVGQADAKRAVAIALRNRWRRMQLTPDMRQEVIPKNILMVGPTGVGKTEIARRLAKIARAPFVKVEATKFTEVGYHGRDVDTIIR